jgi:hypothetical protein
MINKKAIIKELKERVKDGLDVHNLDLIDHQSITNALLNRDIINYWIEEIDMGDDYYIALFYYSQKIGKTIMFDNDFYAESDGESIEAMADSIIALEKEIQDFENRLSIKTNNK